MSTAELAMGLLKLGEALTSGRGARIADAVEDAIIRSLNAIAPRGDFDLALEACEGCGAKPRLITFGKVQLARSLDGFRLVRATDGGEIFYCRSCWLGKHGLTGYEPIGDDARKGMIDDCRF